MDRSYDAENDISALGNAVYISGTKIGRASDWYDDKVKIPSLWHAVPIVNQYKSFMCGMKALPYVGDLARQVGTAVPYALMVSKTVPLLAPEYATTAMKINKSVGSVSMGLKGGPICSAHGE